MPERNYNEVIIPFLSVVENPTQREDLHNLETKMIEQGKMTEEERYVWSNNKLIALSSASYKFEYMYKAYTQFENLIHNQPVGDTSRRAIMQFSYDCAPEQLYDRNLLNQAKSSMSQSQFDREFGAVFTDDSSGYFKISKMAECSIPDGESPSIEVAGEAGAEYLVSFDPSWAESESSDDFAIQVLKLNKEKQIGVVVHSYALAGANMKEHIKYFSYILQAFNVVMVIGDYAGGVQFLSACNESEIFKKDNLKLKTIEVDFEKPEAYNSDLQKARNEYNKTEKKICYLRKPTSNWIRQANELLQSNFDHKRIFFGSRAIDDSYQTQRRKQIPIEKLKYLKGSDMLNEKMTKEAKMIDFVEHQSDMLELTKVECALIQITTTTQGTQTFDLPPNLRRQSGRDKARKDSYSALVLANWMVKTYFDVMNFKPKEVEVTFTPRFIK